MLYKLLTIAKNTFTETIRQPIFLILIIAALLLLILSPSITMYTIEHDGDNKMLKELGLSTLFIAGLFIAIFSSVGAITEELDSKTATTILSKPVSRPVFIIGKFIGLVLSVSVAHFINTVAYMMVSRHGVMSTASDELDMVVIITGGVCLLAAFAISAFLNYSYDMPFISTAVKMMALAGAVCMVVISVCDRNWKFNPAENGLESFNVYASILLLMAIIVLVSISLVFSTRFNIVITLAFTVGIFLLGLVSAYYFGRIADTHLWARICYAIVPDFQVFWVADAILEEVPLKPTYLLSTGLYTICYSTAGVFIASAMFQRRQVG